MIIIDKYSGKNQIMYRRGCLGDEVIEGIECMKSWLKAGLISEEPLLEVEGMLRDLEAKAQGLEQGRVMGSGYSEPGSNISGHIT